MPGRVLWPPDIGRPAFVVRVVRHAGTPGQHEVGDGPGSYREAWVVAESALSRPNLRDEETPSWNDAVEMTPVKAPT